MSRLCFYGCGLEATHKFKNGKSCCNKNYQSCPGFRKKLKKHIQNSWTDDRRKRISIITKLEWKKDNSNLKSEKTVRKRNKKLKQAWSDPHRREKNKQKNKEAWKDPLKRKEAKIRSMNNFKDPVYLEKLRKGLERKPNRSEIKIQNILNTLFPNLYIYCGDFSFWIENRNPDFINKTNHKIIEFFGDFWHSENFYGIPENIQEQQRVELYKKHGYETLIIWEREFKNNEKLKLKLIEFQGESRICQE